MRASRDPHRSARASLSVALASLLAGAAVAPSICKRLKCVSAAVHSSALIGSALCSSNSGKQNLTQVQVKCRSLSDLLRLLNPCERLFSRETVAMNALSEASVTHGAALAVGAHCEICSRVLPVHLAQVAQPAFNRHLLQEHYQKALRNSRARRARAAAVRRADTLFANRRDGVEKLTEMSH